MVNSTQPSFNFLNEEVVEKQIKENQKQFDFDIREYPVEFIVLKFNPEIEDPEIFIPDYQRDFVWSEKQKSLFIESLLIGLPIPYIFVADINEEEDPYAEGRVEVVDGAQRLQTIYAYVKQDLTLAGLERLTELEGTTFEQLPLIRKRRFLRTTVRMIELKNIDEDGRRLMFDRLNSGGTRLTDMEKWIGVTDSLFIDFVRDLAKDPLFIKLTPLSPSKEKRREREQYVLRYFAYLDRYERFGLDSDHSVRSFIENYIEDMNKIFNDNLKEEMHLEFKRMLDFVNKFFDFGFRKSENSKSVSRIRYEAVAVGSSLALRQNSNCHPINTKWVYSDPEFLRMIRSDASNSRVKVINRIDFIKNHLLGISEETNGN